jgi:arylformamidase
MEESVKQCGYDTWEELNKSMSPSRFTKKMHPDVVISHHMESVAKASAEAQKVLDCELDVVYGSGDQKLDFYYPKTVPKDRNEDVKTVFIFIHGGYWQALGKEHGGHMAVPLSKAGIVTVSVGYDLAPKVTLTEIVEECCRAVVFVAKKFPNALLVGCGHSAGAHLAACMAHMEWHQYGMEVCPLKGTVLLDGLYNLAPFKLCTENKAVNVTDLEVSQFSPLMLKVVEPGYPCLIVTAEHTSSEFVKQSRKYHKVLMESGIKVHFIHLADEDHLSVSQVLSDEDSFLIKASRHMHLHVCLLRV